MASVERPQVTWPDLLALLRDELASVRGEAFVEWVVREGFDNEAIVGVAKFLTSSWVESGEKPEALALLAFTVGWGAHRDLRGERPPELESLVRIATAARRLQEALDRDCLDLRSRESSDRHGELLVALGWGPRGEPPEGYEGAAPG